MYSPSAQKPFSHKKVRSGRQVLKSSQNPFCLKKYTRKNKFLKILNHLNQVGALRWVAYKNLACKLFFLQ